MSRFFTACYCLPYCGGSRGMNCGMCGILCPDCMCDFVMKFVIDRSTVCWV